MSCWGACGACGGYRFATNKNKNMSIILELKKKNKGSEVPGQNGQCHGFSM